MQEPASKVKERSQIAELKSKQRKTAGERNKEKRVRIERDKEIKQLRAELAAKDQALLKAVYEKEEAVKGLREEKYISETRLKLFENVAREKKSLKLEIRRLEGTIRTQDEKIRDLEERVESLQRFKDAVTGATATLKLESG